MSRHAPTSFPLLCLVSLLVWSGACLARGLEARVEQHQGRPVIAVDGQRLYPMIYALTEHGRFTWKDVPRRNLEHFAKLGFRLYQIDVWMNRIWSPDGKLDMDQVRQQLRGVLAI